MGNRRIVSRFFRKHKGKILRFNPLLRPSSRRFHSPGRRTVPMDERSAAGCMDRNSKRPIPPLGRMGRSAFLQASVFCLFQILRVIIEPIGIVKRQRISVHPAHVQGKPHIVLRPCGGKVAVFHVIFYAAFIEGVAVRLAVRPVRVSSAARKAAIPLSPTGSPMEIRLSRDSPALLFRSA